MTRLALIALAGWALLAGCDKPKPEDCRKALLNMQHLLGTENLNDTASLEGEVRRCRGGSKRKAVECAIKATTLDELRACDFYKLPDKAVKGGGPAPTPSGSAANAVVTPTGSAVAPAGSAAAGSAAAPGGSATAGSATAGSAAPAGSAATTGSAAPAGSAAGSAK